MKNAHRLLLIASAFAAVATANAAPYINVVGNTAGAFTFTQNANGLSFIGGNFNTLVLADGTTATSLGNSANTNEDSLGLFSLVNRAGSPDAYAGTFALTLSFTVPTVTPSSSVYTAVLTGAVTTVNNNGNSTVRVTFDDDADSDSDPLTVTKTFSYLDPTTGQTGVLSLALNRQYNIGYPGNATGSTSRLGISGQLTATATPGPEAAVPMALGALGMLRRRRRSAK